MQPRFLRPLFHGRGDAISKTNTAGVEKNNKINVFNINFFFFKTFNTLKDLKLDAFPVTNCDLLR